MLPQLSASNSKTKVKTRLIITDKITSAAIPSIPKPVLKVAQTELKNGIELSHQNNGSERFIFCSTDNFSKSSDKVESSRRLASKACRILNKYGVDSVLVSSLASDKNILVGFIEGLILSNYQFHRYKADKRKLNNSISKIFVEQKQLSNSDISKIKNLCAGVYLSRDVVNEPLSYLTAEQFSKEMVKAGKAAGFKTTVFKKNQIKKMKMGGLLSVNLGSEDPPTFNVMEWKPTKAKNKKPIVLVGKGVVYDTGGLSLKPTANSMDFMKSDMGGGAAVLGAMYAVAKNKLPIHVIGLIPATDNRPGKNAYVPGDVITISDNTTVEVLNTDAEGRLCLADALVYAKKYKPELVIDLATLTGAAARALGPNAIAGMRTCSDKQFSKLTEASFNVFERIVEFPLWEDYGEMLNSDIADVKNIGGKYAGAITAGKFLQRFTDYPWIHLDIAGSAFLHSENSYRGKGGTGVGTRLLFNFLDNY
ncbi:MAG: leucyl aminopeptidase [Chitinophagales bacterium]|nr:leucyl aminopeptidase [Chitinophagales bacterium]